MVSQSAAWFALIASEMLTVGDGSTNLPGVGSYIGIALQDGSLPGVARGVLALIVNIVIFDQLLFRPLVRYAHQFKYEDVSDRKVPGSWFYQCLSNSMTGQILGMPVNGSPCSGCSFYQKHGTDYGFIACLLSWDK
ncbi:ABC-type anion transport system, duplicated permease component [Salmonella enterica subsp. arizonae]|uniref:ABC-type anion transport system, duplicated permease component n=1 Tax=Salmonella enterica subsp. arizonae TaxID=59203 RepID=A0A379SPL1_SALER|nr:ABC-type anion transport system, duplicated permease component [Salmonella enterica subsp. arizonae]